MYEICPAPEAMVKPAFYGVKGSHEIVIILPQASEEYGPIDYYFVIVVPEEFAQPPDQFVFREPDRYLNPDVSVVFLSEFFSTFFW